MQNDLSRLMRAYKKEQSEYRKNMNDGSYTRMSFALGPASQALYSAQLAAASPDDFELASLLMRAANVEVSSPPAPLYLDQAMTMKELPNLRSQIAAKIDAI